MNHYPRHVGDITRATFGLSLTEFGAYDRLLDWYYAEERPIPLNVAEIMRITGARSAGERRSVCYVLERFFAKDEDGWHQKRADEEIAYFKEGDADRELRAENERERMRRHREERHRLFAELREANVIPKWDTSIADLRRLHERTCNAPATRTGTFENDTTNAPATAIHKPVASSHKPIANSHTVPTTQPTVESSEPHKVKNSSGARKTAPATEPAKGAETWSAYSTAFEGRYGVQPVRNKKGNSLISQLVDRLGADEAPLVAAHFLRSSRQLYVSSRHALDLLIRDAEAIRTDWATNTHGTETQARQADRTAATGNVFGKLIDEARNGTEG